MKLLALAATTAVTSRRVNTPAPGFFNEQGGYWADQTSDQSRHYPQPPQPSNQQQQGQKPQCANGYYFNYFNDNYNNDHNENTIFDCCTKFEWTFTGFTNPSVEMTRNDQIDITRNDKSRDNRHYYTGVFKGTKHFLYFQFDPTPSNVRWASRYGRWYIGEKLDDPDSADYVTNEFDRVHGSKSCPNDPIEDLWFYKPENKPFLNDDFKFECIEKAHRVEQSVKSCESQKGGYMFYENDTDKCKFDSVVGELVKPMVAQLFQHRQEADNMRSSVFKNNDLDLENLVGTDMVNAINEIKRDKCFKTIDGNQHWPGNYIEGCTGLCNAIKDLDKERYAKNLQQVLYQIVDTYFKAINFSFYQDNNKHREKCVEGFNKLVIAINKFNQFTGYKFGG